MSEDQAIDILHSILAGPEYRFDSSMPWWQQLLAPVLDYAWSLLGQLLQLFSGSVTGREGWVGIAVVGASALVLAVGLGYLVRALRLSIGREAELRTASLAERRERSDRLWFAAQRAAADGELAEAVRLMYLSALYALDERSLVHLEASRTNREHAQALRLGQPSLADAFADLVDRYERVRYGHASVAAEAFTEFNSRAERVRNASLEGAVA
jgi:Domain of unknown function (DUF4129)